MSYYVKAAGGLLLTLASYAVFAVSLVELIKTGTCASGGPYEIAQPCPEGTGKWVAGIFVSVPVGLIGMAFFAFRGDPPSGKSKTSAIGWGTLAFGLFFLATAIAAAYGQWGPDSPENDADVGIAIMVIVFALMGIVPIGIALWSWRLDRSERGNPKQAQSAQATPAGQFSAEGLRKLQQMQRPAEATTASAAPASAPPRLMRSASAVVKSFKYLGESTAADTLVEFELEVTPDGGSPYSVVHKQMVPLAKTAGLSAGTTMRVRVDRQNPAELEIDF